MKSPMQDYFSKVPDVKVGRSMFNRSHAHKTTFNENWLIPILIDEALPGDSFKMKLSGLIRLATPIKPIMDNIYCDIHFFSVPIRLIWDGFKNFMGERDSDYVADSVSIPMETFDRADWDNYPLMDYMGIPRPGSAPASITINVLPFRAYSLIFDEWYRAQDFFDRVQIQKGDTGDYSGEYALRERAKRYDYFTSCLPYPQKGSTAIEIPFDTTSGGWATVWGSDTDVYMHGAVSGNRLITSNGVNQAMYFDSASAQTENFHFGKTADGSETGLRADISNVMGTIVQLREAFQIQKLLEREARSGTRYHELVKSAFGVMMPISQWRSEYLGGGTIKINVHPITQNTPATYDSQASAYTTPQGNLAAMGVGAGQVGFYKSFVEHCYVLGIASIRADMTYQHGLNRLWSRYSKYDFYWPEFAHLGEEAILKREIFCDGTADDALVFGYNERYASYRYFPSLVTGLFNSDRSGSLDVWHLAEHLPDHPSLNSTFITCQTPISRVVAVPSEPHFLADFYFDEQCVRPMPVYSIPGFADHF